MKENSRIGSVISTEPEREDTLQQRHWRKGMMEPININSSQRDTHRGSTSFGSELPYHVQISAIHKYSNCTSNDQTK